MESLLVIIGILFYTILIPASIMFGTRFAIRYFRMRRLHKEGYNDLGSIIKEEFENTDNPEIKNPERDPSGKPKTRQENFAIYPEEVEIG